MTNITIWAATNVLNGSAGVPAPAGDARGWQWVAGLIPFGIGAAVALGIWGLDRANRPKHTMTKPGAWIEEEQKKERKES